MMEIDAYPAMLYISLVLYVHDPHRISITKKNLLCRRGREKYDVYQRETFVLVWSESSQAEDGRTGYSSSLSLMLASNSVSLAACLLLSP